MSFWRLLYVMNVKKTSQKHLVFTKSKNTKCLSNVFCMLWMSKRRLRNILSLPTIKTQNVFLTSFVRYECLKDVSETSCVYWELNNKRCLSGTLWMSKRRLRNISCLLRVEASFCRLSGTLWMSKRRLRNISCLLRVETSFCRFLYVMNVWKTSQECLVVFKDIFWSMSFDYFKEMGKALLFI